jgi:hypothetical protein
MMWKQWVSFWIATYSPDTWLNSPSSLSRVYGMWRMDETHWTKEVCEQLGVYVWEEVDALVVAARANSIWPSGYSEPYSPGEPGFKSHPGH